MSDENTSNDEKPQRERKPPMVGIRNNVNRSTGVVGKIGLRLGAWGEKLSAAHGGQYTEQGGALTAAAEKAKAASELLGEVGELLGGLPDNLPMPRGSRKRVSLEVGAIAMVRKSARDAYRGIDVSKVEILEIFDPEGRAGQRAMCSLPDGAKFPIAMADLVAFKEEVEEAETEDDDEDDDVEV